MPFGRILRKLQRPDTGVPGDLAIPSGKRIYAVGDIHGRVDLLDALHAKILDDANAAKTQSNMVIYLGDYIDRGLHSKSVIDRLLESPLEGFESIHLKGNHEALMLEFLEDASIGRDWMTVGGKATLLSYGVRFAHGRTTKEDIDDLQLQLTDQLPDSHLRFLKSLAMRHSEGSYFFVHAGVRPGRSLESQDDHDLIWIRDPFLTSQDWHGKVIVHGHSTGRQPEMLKNRIGIDTAAYATGVLTCLVLCEDRRSLLSIGR